MSKLGKYVGKVTISNIVQGKWKVITILENNLVVSENFSLLFYRTISGYVFSEKLI